MHRLFWKIFLSFWAALVLFAVVGVITASSFIERMRADDEGSNPRERFRQYRVEAQHVADGGGIEALRGWLNDLDRREPIPILLLDRNAADVLARPVPPFVTDRLLGGERSREKGGRRRPHGARIVLPDGSHYILVPDFQGVTLGRVLRRPRVMAVPLVVAALVSGLVCFFLARYVTAPLYRLRVATEEVAAGNLSHRVWPSFQGRKDEVGALAADFDHMAERIEALVSHQRQLIRDVSHELRSPLARLQAALGLARLRTDGVAEAELDRIELETERLNDLIGQLLSLARLESGNAALKIESFDLAALVETVAQDAAFEAGARRCEVRVVKLVPATVTADARLVHQALENVVRNALKYTDEDTPVDISLAEATADSGQFTVQVRDYGPGVPEHVLPRIFEAFVRVDDARGRESGGYGLGLAIAERSIRIQGGSMSARNESGGGFSVTLTLPREPRK